MYLIIIDAFEVTYLDKVKVHITGGIFSPYNSGKIIPKIQGGFFTP
jgi:hypothetical protein